MVKEVIMMDPVRDHVKMKTEAGRQALGSVLYNTESLVFLRCYSLLRTLLKT